MTPENGDDPNETYDPLQIDKAYGNFEYVLGDLTDRASHSHPLFKSNNATVFGVIEGAPRGIVYSSLQPSSPLQEKRTDVAPG